jgi:hypothetical protein
MEILSYGPDGVPGWVGPITFRGEPISEVPEIEPSSGIDKDSMMPEKEGIAPMKRGMAQLLWRCPICKVNDALIHKLPLFRKESLSCGNCGTSWDVQHPNGNDLRLLVIDGPEDLVGLDMPLSIWYDQMKKGFSLDPIETTSIQLLKDEEVYLVTENVPLQVYRPSFLFEEWSEPEAPQSQPRGKQKPGDWESIGNGRFILTDRRMLWQGDSRELDIYWESVSALYLWTINTLGIRYGTARYRIPLGFEVGLKWLTYAGTIAKKIAEQRGKKITITTY